jgi:hypothetical protein
MSDDTHVADVGGVVHEFTELFGGEVDHGDRCFLALMLLMFLMFLMLCALQAYVLMYEGNRVLEEEEVLYNCRDSSKTA